MLKAENQSYRLDRETGRLRIPIRGTEGLQVQLPLSEWHRSILSDPSLGLGSLILVPGKVIVVVRKETPKAYEAEAAIDASNESSSIARGAGSGTASGRGSVGCRRCSCGPRRIVGPRLSSRT